MKVIVITEYQENYSDNPKNPHWKNKGTHEFIIDISQCDIKPIDYINGSKEVDEMITNVIKDECNEAEKFIVLEIKPQFGEPTDLTEKFKAKFYSLENFEIVG